jgi:phosphomannomutase/phosphoglucomutase
MENKIFREYDIRGIAGKEITAEDVVLIGKAAGSYLLARGKKKIAVGRDCRETSPDYSEKLIEGLLTTGIDVVDIGICPTPVLYFSVHHFNLEGGIMVTASHNPPEYNGFKMCCGHDSIHGQGLQDIFAIIDGGRFTEGKGTVSEKDAVTPYTQYMMDNTKISKIFKVGVDAGNGTAGPVILPILKNAGCEVMDLYCDMDGTFPNHEADPTVLKNMQDLIAIVRENNLDVGVGYDGDGDRIGVVDEKGRIVYGDQLMIIFAREILSRKPGAVFISEVKCSQTMYNDIEAHGGNGIMWKTGHSLIKKKMKEEKAELAGEMSGHMFFADRYLGYDDATYATLRLLEIMADSGKTVSELLEGIPETFNTPEIRVECPDDIKFKVVEDMTDYFRQRNKVIDIDGVRMIFEDGWGLVRASNTQPALVLRFEALSAESLAVRKKMVEGVLEDVLARYAN